MGLRIGGGLIQRLNSVYRKGIQVNRDCFVRQVINWLQCPV